MNTDELRRFISRGRAAQQAVNAVIDAHQAPPLLPGPTFYRLKIQYPRNVQAYACALLWTDEFPQVGTKTGGGGRVSSVYRVGSNAAWPVTHTPPEPTK